MTLLARALLHRALPRYPSFYALSSSEDAPDHRPTPCRHRHRRRPPLNPPPRPRHRQRLRRNIRRHNRRSHRPRRNSPCAPLRRAPPSDDSGGAEALRNPRVPQRRDSRHSCLSLPKPTNESGKSIKTVQASSVLGLQDEIDYMPQERGAFRSSCSTTMLARHPSICCRRT